MTSTVRHIFKCLTTFFSGEYKLSNWSAGVKTELQLLHILYVSVMVSNLSWKSHKKEILHKVNAMAADIYLCMNPLNMQFQIISKECKNSAALDTKELFPKRFGVWLTQNLTFGRKCFIVWSIPISETRIQSNWIQNTLNNKRSLPAPSQLFKQKFHKAYPLSKAWFSNKTLRSGSWVTDSKSATNRTAKTSSKGIMEVNSNWKTLENQVSCRPN